ncbi:MAG: hypothetical protein K8T20_13770 [Planctomycetes bacterium]|nr:hypothetical protein [Planctomycetota bacterium]
MRTLQVLSRLAVLAAVFAMAIPAGAQEPLPLPKTLEEVEKASKDPDEDVRMTAVSTVAKYQDHPRECVEIVMRLMKDVSDEVSHRAGSWIERMGQRFPDLIQAGLDHDDFSVAQWAFAAIRNVGTPDPAWLPRIRYWLAVPSNSTPEAVLRLYGDKVDVAAELAEAAKTRKKDEARLAEAVAGKSEAALADLADIIEHGNPYYSSEATRMAAKGGDEAVLRVLLKSSRATHASRRVWILKALPTDDPKWSEFVFEAEIDALSGPTNMEFRTAVQILTRSRHGKWIDELTKEAAGMTLNPKRWQELLSGLLFAFGAREYDEAHHAAAEKAFLEIAAAHRDLALPCFAWWRSSQPTPPDPAGQKRVSALEEKFKAMK